MAMDVGGRRMWQAPALSRAPLVLAERQLLTAVKFRAGRDIEFMRDFEAHTAAE